MLRKKKIKLKDATEGRRAGDARVDRLEAGRRRDGLLLVPIIISLVTYPTGKKKEKELMLSCTHQVVRWSGGGFFFFGGGAVLRLYRITSIIHA